MKKSDLFASNSHLTYGDQGVDHRAFKGHLDHMNSLIAKVESGQVDDVVVIEGVKLNEREEDTK